MPNPSESNRGELEPSQKQTSPEPLSADFSLQFSRLEEVTWQALEDYEVERFKEMLSDPVFRLSYLAAHEESMSLMRQAPIVDIEREVLTKFRDLTDSILKPRGEQAPLDDASDELISERATSLRKLKALVQLGFQSLGEDPELAGPIEINRFAFQLREVLKDPNAFLDEHRDDPARPLNRFQEFLNWVDETTSRMFDVNSAEFEKAARLVAKTDWLVNRETHGDIVAPLKPVLSTDFGDGQTISTWERIENTLESYWDKVQVSRDMFSHITQTLSTVSPPIMEHQVSGRHELVAQAKLQAILANFSSVDEYVSYEKQRMLAEREWRDELVQALEEAGSMGQMLAIAVLPALKGRVRMEFAEVCLNSYLDRARREGEKAFDQITED